MYLSAGSDKIQSTRRTVYSSHHRLMFLFARNIVFAQSLAAPPNTLKNKKGSATLNEGRKARPRCRLRRLLTTDKAKYGAIKVANNQQGSGTGTAASARTVGKHHQQAAQRRGDHICGSTASQHACHMRCHQPDKAQRLRSGSPSRSARQPIKEWSTAPASAQCPPNGRWRRRAAGWSTNGGTAAPIPSGRRPPARYAAPRRLHRIGRAGGGSASPHTPDLL